MKTNVSLLIVFLCGALAFTACDNDDNFTPENVVVSAFNSKYPEAKKVEWETKSGYKVADFYLNSKDTEAWFASDGKWVMTETDIPFNELPKTVQDSFNSSTYASWRIDDVDKLERADSETIYIIEAEQGKQEFDLYYTEDGTLIKEINENGNNAHEPLVIPSTILEEIARMYPNARFLEFERKAAYLEIDILDGKTHKEVVFNDKNEWVYTEWEIRTSEVPDVVMKALKASEYGNYKIDDVDIVEKPDGQFYVFELESGNKEVYLTIKADGTINTPQ